MFILGSVEHHISQLFPHQASCPSSLDVDFCVPWRGILDSQLDVRDVDSCDGIIGGNDEPNFPIHHHFEGLGSPLIWAVAINNMYGLVHERLQLVLDKGSLLLGLTED